MDEIELKRKAYLYGKAVAWRERMAHYADDQRWRDINGECMALWLELKEAGAYVDSEASQLRDDLRPWYYGGMVGREPQV